MREERIFVVTTFGHKRIFDKISVSCFDCSTNYQYDDPANAYCKMMNSLELKDGTWINAKIISENIQYEMRSFIPTILSELILSIDDLSLQKTFRELDTQDIMKVVYNSNNVVREKIFRNMSSRASKMLKEDMEYMSPFNIQEVKEAQDKMLFIIKRLIELGVFNNPLHEQEE